MTLIIWGCVAVLVAKPMQSSNLQENPNQVVIDSSQVMLMVERADSLAHLGDIPEAKTILEEAFKKAKTLDIAALTQWVQIERAANYLEYDQPDSAQRILELTLDQVETDSVKARALSLLGSAYRYQGKYDEALQQQEMAKALIDSTRQLGLYGKINLNMGSIYGDKGDFGNAFKYYLSGIKAVEAVGDSTSLATGLNNIGVAYNNYEQPEKARSYLQRALTIEEKLNDKLGLLRATNNLAISEFRLKEYDEAITLYNRAIELHKEVRPEVPPFRILYNLGQVYKEMGDFVDAENYYQQSLTYSQEAGILVGLIYNYGGLADVAEQQNDYAKARDYYNRALDTSNQIGAGSLQKAALNSLYNLEKRLNNTAAALSYYEQYVALNDSLNKIAQEQTLADTETKLNLRQQEEVNRLLQEKQLQQQERITMQKWLITVAAAIIIIILLLLFLLYRFYAQKKKTNAELHAQRNRLEETSAVKDKMLAVIAHDLRSPLAAMHGMLYLIEEEELSESELDQITTELNVSLLRSLSMLDNLLAWAREQMNGLRVRIETISPNQIVEKIFVNHAIQAKNKEIELKNDTLTSLKVRADHNLLELILRNLIANSLKFSGNGDTITVTTIEEDQMVLFKVEDTGIGIPMDLQKNIFSINSTSRLGTSNEKGSGLGLQLCKEFVEKQQGQIRLESVEGEGTTIIFSLPKA